MNLNTLEDIRNLIKSDTETDTIEFKKTTGQLERGMVSECRRVGIPAPEFHTDGNSVWVVFRYNGRTVGNVPTVTPQSPHSHPTLSPQVKKVLSAIGEQTLSTKEIMGALGLNDKSNFLELYLYPAIRQGLAEAIYPKSPKHPGQKYRLTKQGTDLL